LFEQDTRPAPFDLAIINSFPILENNNQKVLPVFIDKQRFENNNTPRHSMVYLKSVVHGYCRINSKDYHKCTRTLYSKQYAQVAEYTGTLQRTVSATLHEFVASNTVCLHRPAI
jgi:hypothetical protein